MPDLIRHPENGPRIKYGVTTKLRLKVLLLRHKMVTQFSMSTFFLSNHKYF